MEVSRTGLLMRRVGAYILDMAALILTLHGLNEVGLYFGPFFQASSYLFYFLIFEWVWGGKTPGKFVFQICVINGAGGPPTFVQSLIRGITRHIEVLLGIITVFILAKSEKFQRVGDILAKTYVIPTRDLAQLRIATRSEHSPL